MAKGKGRPSKYDKTIPPLDQIEVMAEKGFTNYDFEDVFHIAHSTFSIWIKEHPDLSNAIKKGKEKADSKVEQSLFHRANGYSHDAVKIFLNKKGKTVYAKYIEHYLPDTMACIYWLNNRQPSKWSQKPEVNVEINGEDQVITIAGKEVKF